MYTKALSVCSQITTSSILMLHYYKYSNESPHRLMAAQVACFEPQPNS